jgi:hypothetical protein
LDISQAISIASFVIALLGIFYSFGLRDARLKTLEDDVNSIGIKLEKHNNHVYAELKSFDKRADSQSIFLVTIDQRVRNMQENTYGEKRTERMRETDKEFENINQNDSVWRSDNSGIDL